MTTTCHTCDSIFTVCTDVFGRSYCYEHARKWIDHLAAVVESGDVHKWCERGGSACPKELIKEDSKMLVLQRKRWERICIGDDIVVEVTEIKGSRDGARHYSTGDSR